ncbi:MULTISPECIES: replicative DNA helicase [Chelativorans]|jgi:replicative DNA helicase|uniref:DNA 5'-3' helicase n=1 Tax=Chelativorans sp. (strain BNC1) TaxID=266779 RepID=Q11J25_CHESB|nr:MULTISPECIES: DnaB-like helicase N-terminal domain-containing protein [Chelativorans]
MNALADPIREVPHNIEAEQALLGAVMVNNACYDLVSRIVRPEHFFEPLHRDIFKASGDLITVGRRADPITLRDFLPADAKVGEMTVAQYLAALCADAVTIVMARDYAASIFDAWMSRQIIVACEDTVAKLYQRRPGMDPLTEAGPVEDMLAKLRAERVSASGTASHGRQYLQSLTEARQRGKVLGVPICLPEIAAVISEPSFEAGNLYGLLSSSGEGKTSLTLQIIMHALKKGHPVQFLSFDQSAEQCIRQLVAQEHGIEARRQRAGDLSEKEWETVVDFSNWMDREPFEVVKCTDHSAPQLLAFARAFVKRFGNGNVPLIVVDHIGAVKPEDRRADEGTKAKDINKVFKAGAEQTGAAWLILNQRNSYGMKRDNPRPISADLFGGDPAKQAYDAIFYVYRYLKFLEERKAIASSESDWKKIAKVFPSAVREGGEDIAQIGAIKVRFGNAAITRNLIFEARFTRYRSEQMNDQPELMEAML